MPVLKKGYYMRRKTKYQVYVVADHDCFGDGRDQLIATFENVDEDFMEEVCHFIPDIRDVKCRWQEAPQDTKEQNGHNAQQAQAKI